MKKGFTLIELLIVVLIIGILSAIALPMYQGAVDKSHWSTMLPGAKAIKDAEEAFKMSNDGYTDTMANLDVTMENSDLTFSLITPNNTSDPNVIRVTNSKLANVRLASYLDDNPKFAGQLHCEALAGDERANRLCEKLLMGQYLKTTDDGYTRYLLDQSADKATCGAATGSWSSSKTKCYNDTTTRCSDLGMGVVASMDDQCGYENISGQTINAEGKCLGNNSDGGCSHSKIYQGGVCDGTGYLSCSFSEVYDGGKCVGNGTGPCHYSKIYSGGICESNGWNTCGAVHVYNGGICEGLGCSGYIHDGGKCIAKGSSACRATYEGTGCCEEGVPGQTNCPSDAPKC